VRELILDAFDVAAHVGDEKCSLCRGYVQLHGVTWSSSFVQAVRLGGSSGALVRAFGRTVLGSALPSVRRSRLAA
jgi:hypothetical protein